MLYHTETLRNDRGHLGLLSATVSLFCIFFAVFVPRSVCVLCCLYLILYRPLKILKFTIDRNIDSKTRYVKLQISHTRRSDIWILPLKMSFKIHRIMFASKNKRYLFRSSINSRLTLKDYSHFKGSLDAYFKI